MNKTHENITENSANGGYPAYHYWHERKGEYPKAMVGAAASGSLLHQMLLKERLSFEEFAAGHAFVRLYSLVMRSKGIKTGIRSYCQNWDRLYGIKRDNFRVPELESLWRKLLAILAKRAVYKKVLMELAAPYSPAFGYSTPQTKAALRFLNGLWQACGDTAYGKQVARLREF